MVANLQQDLTALMLLWQDQRSVPGHQLVRVTSSTGGTIRQGQTFGIQTIRDQSNTDDQEESRRNDVPFEGKRKRRHSIREEKERLCLQKGKTVYTAALDKTESTWEQT